MKDFSLVIYRFENNYTVDDSYKLLLTAPEKAKDVLAYCFYNYLKSIDDECETFSEKMDSFVAEIKDFNTNKNRVFGEIEDDGNFGFINKVSCKETPKNIYYLAYATVGTVIRYTKLFATRKEAKAEVKRISGSEYDECGYTKLKLV